jgi:hypothetical protein
MPSCQPGGQRGPTPEEHADETQQVTKQLANASQGDPEVPDEVEDAVHAALIAETALTDNGP